GFSEEVDTEPSQILRAKIVLDIAGMNTTIVRRGIPYRPHEPDSPTLQVRYPSASTQCGRLPALVFVTGYGDLGFESIFGCKQKDTGSYVSWSKLVAACGIAAVTYENIDPATDAGAVLDFIGQSGRE